MGRNGLIGVTALVVTAASLAQTTFVQDDFSGGSVPLDGVAADVGGTWSASAGWLADGSIVATQDSGALLAFEPVVDAQYTLTAVIENSTSQWLAVGFAQDGLTAPGGTAAFVDRHSNDLGGVAWMLYRNDPARNDIEVFAGPGTAGGLFGGDVPGVDFSTPTEIRIEVDTTGDGSSFRAEFFVDGVSLLGAPATIAVPVATIDFVGLSFDAAGAGGCRVLSFGIEGEAPDPGPTDGPVTRVSSVYPYGYAQNDINSVSFTRSSLVTSGGYQFVAFYSAIVGNRMQIARRPLGTDAWEIVNTGLVPVTITDSHNNINLAVDGAGRLHVAWGVHNHPMRYRISQNPVTGPEFNAGVLQFDAPAYWSGTAANADSAVTYPEFTNIPGTGDLLFVYRQGGSGGGSGNGDSWFTRYDTRSGTFEKNLVIQGTATSVNAYLNRLVYDSAGRLHMSWTWRDTPDFQTNHNIMYAVSEDNGLSFGPQSGGLYTLPITEPQAQVLATIPQGSTLINQTDMAVDMNDYPLIATWYAPRAQQGDDTRQYMLHWWDGSQWRVTQISDRVGIGNSGERNVSNVRDLARPLVMVDRENRVYFVMRYDEAGNGIVVAVSEDRENWELLTLSDVDMGDYEPSYDPVLWKRDNRLHLFHQPMGPGFGSFQPVGVLEWDAAAHFGIGPDPDFNADGSVDFFDVLSLLVAVDAGDPSADLDGSGSVDSDDVLALIRAIDG